MVAWLAEICQRFFKEKSLKRSTSHLRGLKIDKCPACIFFIPIPKGGERKNLPPGFNHTCTNKESIYYDSPKTIKDKCNKLKKKEGK